MYRAIIFFSNGLGPMKHSLAEAETPEEAFVKAGEEFFGDHIVRQLTWQPATGIVLYDGHVPCGAVFQIKARNEAAEPSETYETDREMHDNHTDDGCNGGHGRRETKRERGYALLSNYREGKFRNGFPALGTSPRFDLINELGDTMRISNAMANSFIDYFLAGRLNSKGELL